MNHNLLLLAHVICADLQLHSEEVSYLDKLIEENGADTATIELRDNIFAQSENYPSLEECANLVPHEERQKLFTQILKIAYVDGYLSPLEEIAIDRITDLWKFSQTEVDRGMSEVEQSDRTHREKNLSDKVDAELSAGAKAFKVAETHFPTVLGAIKKTARIMPAEAEIVQKIDRLQREVLLAGTEYDEAVLRCAKVAAEDYEFVELRLRKTEKTLEDLRANIDRQTQALQKSLLAGGNRGSAKEVIKQIDETKAALDTKIIQQLQKIRASLDAKSRALSHFSITFMGKTKAGKSTLHAVVTGEGWNAIGVGKQRTTRYNRVYEWKNIRIIDTPGIGAPGGRSDEEIAESVIDESDVICYVVTNDSVQESDFKFLEVLKSNAKPLILLMNLKRNLRDPRLLKDFLANPNKLFVRQGNNTLEGHFNRIRTYAEKHYRNNAFEIIPVMLLAAQMSKEEAHQADREKLFDASRLQDFLNIIRESIITNGVIRRSQTFLGSTAGNIERPLKELQGGIKAYQQLLAQLNEKRKSIKQEVSSQEGNTERVLRNKVKYIFEALRKKANDFARENFRDDGKIISEKWNAEIERNNLREQIEIAIKQAGEAYNKEIASILEEVGKDLQLMAQLSGGSFDVYNTYSNFSMKIGGSVLVIAGVVVGFIFPPLGMVMGLVGAAMSWISGWFKSDEEKKREAIEKIEKSLREQLDKLESQVIKEATDGLTEQCKNISSTIDFYFQGLIEGLELILKEMITAESKLKEVNRELNFAYSKRIIDYCQDRHEELTMSNIQSIVHSVQRDFGGQMTISIHSKSIVSSQFFDPKYQEKIGNILQDKIVFERSPF